MRRFPAPRLPAALLCAAAAVLIPVDAHARQISGRVIQLGWGEPVAGALVVLLDAGLAQVDSVQADASGEFVFAGVARGTYQLQASAEGEFSTLSDAVRVDGGATPVEVELVMPSVLMNRALACLNTSGAQAGVLAGVAYEVATRSPLPGARVRVKWSDPAGPREAEMEADGKGRYAFCDVPGGRELQVSIWALGREGPLESLVIEAGTLHRADLGMPATAAAGEAPRLAILDRIDTGDETGRITGRVMDALTGQPVSAAVVAVPTADAEVLTDGGGRFRLENLPPAVHVIELVRIGYGEQAVSFEVREGEEAVVELTLSSRPVTLPGVSVDARRPLLGLTDVKSSRIVTGADMAAYERRGATLESVVRERFPIRVHTGVYNVQDLNRRITCMESRRRTTISRSATLIQTDTILEYPKCDMIPVFVDDAPVADPGTFIEHVRVDEYESIVYLAPTEVGLRYGLEGHSSGVLLLYTRGRGPFVDRARNVREP